MDTALEATFRPISKTWVSMWLHPRRTLRRQLGSTPSAAIWVLAALAGITAELSSAPIHRVQAWPLTLTILVAAVVGSILGVAGLFLGAKLLTALGELLGGDGTEEDLRTALAWSAVPAAVQLPLAIAIAVIFNRMVFGAQDGAGSPLLALVVAIGTLALGVLTLWQLVLTVACVSEAHHVTVARAAMAVITPLPIAVVLVLGLRVLLA